MTPHPESASASTMPHDGSESETRGQALRSSVSQGSPLGTYQDLVVGSRSLLDLLRYELVAAWGARVPGAAGLAFRKVTWPALFRSAGAGTVWGEGIVVRHPARMEFGRGVVIDDQAYLDAKGCSRGGFVIGNESMISRNALLSAKEGPIHLGDRVTLGAGCSLYSFGSLEIGDDTIVAAHCFIGGGRYDHQGNRELPMHEQPQPGRGVKIGSDCWIGAGVTIVDGVEVGDGSVIGAGSVVLDDVGPRTIVGGIPARKIGDRCGAAAS